VIGVRSRVWALAAVVAGLAVIAPGASAAAGVEEARRLRLPEPTGADRVGTTSVHLVDGGRVDPLAPTVRAREVMVRLWYPAARSGRAPVAGYFPQIQAGALTEQLNALLGTDFPGDLLTFPTHSRVDAPAAPGPRRPVLLFSPGFGTNAALYTGIHEELASRGYIVAGIDHTFDAPAVEFPGGRLEIQNPDLLPGSPELLATRVADVRFVLDQLAAGRLPLPRDLGRAMDLGRVAAFGHSLGSITTIAALEADPRLVAGAVLDGNPLGPASLDRPFLMLGNQGHRRADDPDWAGFYDRLRGPRLHLVIDGTEHADLSDVTIFKHTIDIGAIFQIGPIDGARALAIQRRYLTAWLDHTLRNRPVPLLRGESPRFPEVDFQP
jgi:pimeloyl-ACP methyl ester carboxylesterase